MYNPSQVWSAPWDIRGSIKCRTVHYPEASGGKPYLICPEHATHLQLMTQYGLEVITLEASIKTVLAAVRLVAKPSWKESWLEKYSSTIFMYMQAVLYLGETNAVDPHS